MTTNAPTAVRGMTAISKDAMSKMKPLGFITWFSVPDEDISWRRLTRIWSVAGLDPAPLPKDPKAINAFKRAVRDLEKVGPFVDPDTGERSFTDPKTGYKTETDVRLLLENEEDVIYEVARVTRDPDTGIEYPKAVRVWFTKERKDPVTGIVTGGEIGFKPLGGLTRAEVIGNSTTPGIMDQITEAYEANATRVTGAKVRTLVRNYIRDDAYAGRRNGKGDIVGYSFGLSGENMRGKAGGVYFVTHGGDGKHLDQLNALAECLHELYPAGKAYLYFVPMADGKSEREMICARQTANCMDELKSELGEVHHLLRDERERGVRENVRLHHEIELEKLRRRVAHYQDALGEEQEELEDKLGILDRQLRKLRD